MTSYFNACDVTVANSNHKICYNFFSTCTCAPHFEKGSANHDWNVVTVRLLIVLFWVNSKICRKTDSINLLTYVLYISARMFGTDARILKKVEVYGFCMVERSDSKPQTCQHYLLIRIQTTCCATERLKATSPSIFQMRRLLHFIHVQCTIQVASKWKFSRKSLISR